jgi:hypothetical protein
MVVALAAAGVGVWVNVGTDIQWSSIASLFHRQSPSQIAVLGSVGPRGHNGACPTHALATG